MVDEIIAKSKPKEDLKEHTEKLLNNYVRFRNFSFIKLNEEEWKILYKACLFHDFGKANDYFQAKVRGIINDDQEIPHNYLSIAFIPEDEDFLISKLVAFHHWREFPDIDSEKIRFVLKSMEKYIPKLKEYFGIEINILKPIPFIKKLEKIREYYSKRLDYPIDVVKEKKFVILLGLLNRLDHSSSADVEIEKEPLNKQPIVEILLNNKTDSPWQLEKLKCCDINKSGIVVASTGMGKTEMGLLWGKKDKTFYTLPVRTSVNAMYERLKKIFGKENVGILHSDAVGWLLLGEVWEREEDTLIQYDLARNLSYPIMVTTADQIFASALKFLGFEKIYATLAYSKVIVDEIQVYSPHTAAIIISCLKEILEMGGKYIILTATLPPIIKERIPYDFYIEHIPELYKHTIKLVPEDMEETIEKYIEKYNHEKILIICNTIKKAQKIFKILCDKKYCVLLHSAFTRLDRKDKEKEILDNSFKGILVATQVVEVSLDIDFDIIFTELAPIEVLIQRMGRIFRRYKKPGYYAPDEPNVYIFYGNPSGYGNVYEREMIDKTLEFLRDGVISEKEKFELVERFYSKENLKNTKYLTTFESSLELVKNFKISRRSEAQNLFREIDSISIIPKCLLSVPHRNKELLKRLGFHEKSTLIHILNNVDMENRIQKVLVFELIKDLLVPIRISHLKGSDFYKLSDFIENNKAFEDIIVGDFVYDDLLGLQI